METGESKVNPFRKMASLNRSSSVICKEVFDDGYEPSIDGKFSLISSLFEMVIICKCLHDGQMKLRIINSMFYKRLSIFRNGELATSAMKR